MNSELNVREFIKQFLEKSDEVEFKHDLLRKKYDPNDLGFIYGSDESNQLAKESEPLDNELINFLELLKHDELLIVNALMYAGRDLNEETKISFDHLKSQLDDSTKSLIYDIKSKGPRGEYIRRGLALYGDDL